MTEATESKGSVLIALPALRHVMNTDWRESAACAKLPKNVFFDYNLVTIKRELKDEHMATAFKTCKSCPVNKQCFEFAVKNNEMYGIWAGTLPDQRKKLYKEFMETGVLETV